MVDAADEKIQPVELKLDRRNRLEIRWSDGRRSELTVSQLRKACPCASCRHEREQRSSNPLAVIQPEADPVSMTTVRRAELVGNYALQIIWEDGHNTGIYDFGLLRRLSL